MTARVAIGNLGGGKFGLRSTLPGYDVLTEPENSANLSFDSNWTNLVSVRQAGVVSYPWIDQIGSVFFMDTGYAPIAEARYYSGNVVYDDFLQFGDRNRGTTSRPSNYYQTKLIVRVYNNQLQIQGRFDVGQALYVVYNRPIA
jgi:hypothetical protein